MKFWVIVVIALVGAGLGAPPANAIINGAPARPGQVPWQVMVTARSMDSGVHCGGTLIEPRTVITAAHCVDGLSARDVLVRSGSLVADETGPSGVDEIRVHSGFERKALLNDVAIVKLRRPIRSGSSRIELAPTGSDPAPGSVLFASGWGSTFSGGPVSRELRLASLTVVDRQDCVESYRSHGQVVNNAMICTASTHSAVNTGDSGGPLFARRGQSAVLEGIVSFGAGHGSPDVFTRVGAVRGWIDANL